MFVVLVMFVGMFSIIGCGGSSAPRSSRHAQTDLLNAEKQMSAALEKGDEQMLITALGNAEAAKARASCAKVKLSSSFKEKLSSVKQTLTDVQARAEETEATAQTAAKMVKELQSKIEEAKAITPANNAAGSAPVTPATPAKSE